MKEKVTIFWFRRDLRLEDNHGLFQALCGNFKVLPIFIFDQNILEHLPADDPRVTFIHNTLQKLNNILKTSYNSGISLFFDTPERVFEQLMQHYELQGVVTNRDYEPYAQQRDARVEQLLSQHQRTSDGVPIPFETFKDQVIFECNEVVKKDGTPYRVFTPYKRVWCSRLEEHPIQNYETFKFLGNLINQEAFPTLTLEAMGFIEAKISVPEYSVAPKRIQDYEATRNFPAQEATSRLGPHLRFGTVSIRQMVQKAVGEENKVFLSELIWRSFFMQILWHFPQTLQHAFKPKYDRIIWRNNELEFEKWKTGTTGYPLVDAGMRQLNTTGFMHNRVRMVVGSFLCKHLLIDWRWGEAYFAQKLLDYDRAANVGNWQWVAGCGVDAAPYFRIFNPTAQLQKFDQHHDYINTWIEDINEFTYPVPMVDHKMARERCLTTYKAALE